jgi:hypothetical protein
MDHQFGAAVCDIDAVGARLIGIEFAVVPDTALCRSL